MPDRNTPASTARARLVERIRGALATEPSTREVRMFGGVSFLVDDALVVAADRAGDLLVRCDPGRHGELAARPGARPAQMGADRIMGPGWISVAHDEITRDEQLSGWLEVALEYHAGAGRGSQ